LLQCKNFQIIYVAENHKVIYIHLNDKNNCQSFEKNIQNLISKHNFTHFEYQLPDEYRVDLDLKNLCKSISITSSVVDSEHFFTTRNELGEFFEGKKIYLMESFYRAMRKKHNVLMEGDKPLTGQWNYDGDNRMKLPKSHKPIAPLVFNNDVSKISR
jgi:deoxyribodipyrimidine photolyase-related protein